VTELTATHSAGTPVSYEIARGEEVIGTLRFARWRRRATIEVAGERLEFRRECWGGAFVTNVEEPDRATLPAGLRTTFDVTIDGSSCSLISRGLGRGYRLLQGDREVGSVRPRSVFSRDAHATLPDSLSTAAQLFVLWLVVSQWAESAPVIVC